jgi:hypothetical protein
MERGGRVIGYAACKIPIKKISEIVNVRTGLGKTGETYLVGKVDNISLFYFDRKESWKIDIEDNGNLSRPLGKGFFDEADEIATELFYHVNNKLN